LLKGNYCFSSTSPFVSSLIILIPSVSGQGRRSYLSSRWQFGWHSLVGSNVAAWRCCSPRAAHHPPHLAPCSTLRRGYSKKGAHRRRAPLWLYIHNVYCASPNTCRLDHPTCASFLAIGGVLRGRHISGEAGPVKASAKATRTLIRVFSMDVTPYDFGGGGCPENSAPTPLVPGKFICSCAVLLD